MLVVIASFAGSKCPVCFFRQPDKNNKEKSANVCSYRIYCVILPDKKTGTMNFEEILNARQSVITHREKTPLGDFYKKQNEGKYCNVVQLDSDLTDSIVFCEALKADVEWSAQQKDGQQMHGELHEDSSGIYELELETGNFQTLAAVFENNPAIVTNKGFVDRVFSSVAEFLEKMHGEGIYQLCLAPQNIFLRKSSDVPMILMHGSFYQGINDLTVLYADMQDYLAPEVMEHQTVDERSDVYALGRLVEFLYSQGEMPFEYKQIVKKATAPEPDKRFKSIAEMRGTLDNKRNVRRTLIAFIAAVVLSLLAVWIYIDWMPEANTVEFVEPAPRSQSADDIYGSYYDPEMGMIDEDPTEMTDLDRMYQQKAEEIFRRNYAKEADRILSDIYDNSRMSATEKNYRAGSQSMAEELIKLQTEMGEQAGLTEEEAGRIGQQIVEQITKQKQEQLTHKGYIKSSEEEEEN